MNVKSSGMIPRVLLASCLAVCAPAQRQVAITIDDLPRGGDAAVSAAEDRAMTIKLLAPFAQEHIPLTGFVNECHHADEAHDLLALWVAAGAELGNHTCSHLDLSSAPVAAFEADILKGETVTSDVMGRPPRYFRYPYLHTGTTDRIKEQVQTFVVKQRGYVLAPVTLDTADYMFAKVYAAAIIQADSVKAMRIQAAYLKYMEGIFVFFEKWSATVTGHEIKQILLIHANQLNADSMPQLLRLIRRRGYELISLGEALTDDAYQLPDEYVGPMGISSIHRWAMAKGMKVQWEPDPPESISAEFKQLSEK